MKKFITLCLLAVMLLAPGQSLFAATDVTFFEALGNFSQLNDYKVIQSFYGNMELEEYEDHLSGDYRLTVNSVIDSESKSSFNRVSAYLKFVNQSGASDSTPFNEMTVQANGEVIVKNQKDVYFKLNNFNIGLVDGEPFAIVDVENWIAMSDLYKRTWFHLPTDELAQTDSNIDVNQYIEFENQFKEEPKEAILGLTQQTLEDSSTDLTDQDIQQVMEAVGLALNTKLFMERDVVTGRNTGFKFFNLSKSAIINFFTEFGKIIGEELTDDDISELRDALGQISISGIYRIEDTLGIIDNLLVRLRLSDVDLLKQLEVNYRFKLSDLNEDNKISPPSDYEEWVSPAQMDGDF